MTRHTLLILLTFCCGLGISPLTIHSGVAAAQTGVKEPVRAILIALIASPRPYDGAIVQVGGFLDVSYESDALYLHVDDYRYGITKNAVKITFASRAQADQFKALSGKYVIVEGIFRADRSERERFSGHLVNPTRIQQLRTEEEFERSQHGSVRP